MRAPVTWLAVVALLSAACGGAGPASSPTPDPFAGAYKGPGGGGALPVVQALTKRFSDLHPGVVWELTDVGSDSSVSLVQKGDADFGYISRELKAPEKGTVDLLSVGAVGTAVAVNGQNPVKGLTKEQVRDIFGGKITDWAQVGGEAGKIRVLVREANAATRSNFESFFFDGKPAYSKDAVEIFEKQETLKTITSFKDAVGMVTIAADTLADDRIRLLAIDGTPATRDNLLSGAYKIRRPLYVIYGTDPRRLKPGIVAFLDFIRGSEGQKILAGF